MNKQELIEAVIELPVDCSGSRPKIDKLTTLELVKLLDEPETGHADEAPRYVKNILARLRELPVHDREVWLKVIMSEFKQDFGHAKYNEGYEKGKRAGFNERNKPKVPQFIVDWYEENKDDFEYSIWEYILRWNSQKNSEFHEWMNHSNNKPLQTLVNMHQFGYTVEKEPKYTIKVKAVLGQYLGRYYLNNEELTPQFIRTQLTGKEKLPTFTRKELEEAGFGWVFDCEGIEIEEVEE